MRSEGLETWKAPAAMKRMWSVETMPYLVLTVVPSTMGRMSRWTPSRLTSGPWPPSRPAILSISSRKTMPESSTRSTARRVTWSMSMRRPSSSWMRYSKASTTFILRFFVRWPKRPGRMSLRLPESGSSEPLELMTSKVAWLRSRTSSSTMRSSSLPLAELVAKFFAGGWGLVGVGGLGGGVHGGGELDEVGAGDLDGGGGVGGGGGGGVCRWEQEVEEAIFGGELGLVFDVFELFFADHVDGDLDEVADDGFDVAADVADLGELGGFDLEEGRVGELGETAGDLGFADAGGADHDDVFGHDLVGELGRELLATGAIAQGDGDGALGGGLADDVLVELEDDLARGHLVEGLGLIFGGGWEVDCHDAWSPRRRVRSGGVTPP